MLLICPEIGGINFIETVRHLTTHFTVGINMDLNYFYFDAEQAVLGLLAFLLWGFIFGGILGLFRYLFFVFIRRGGE